MIYLYDILLDYDYIRNILLQYDFFYKHCIIVLFSNSIF